MKEALDTALRQSPNVGSAAATIRFLIKSDLNDVERRIREHFAGQRVRWAPDPGNKDAPSVRIWALQETAAFPFELDALKQRLDRLRDPTTKPSIVYAFPPIASRLDPRDDSASRDA